VLAALGPRAGSAAGVCYWKQTEDPTPALRDGVASMLFISLLDQVYRKISRPLSALPRRPSNLLYFNNLPARLASGFPSLWAWAGGLSCSRLQRRGICLAALVVY
jgi:hypothetical protein